MEEELLTYDAARTAKFEGLREMADYLVAKYPETFDVFTGLPLEACVGMVSAYRASGRAVEAIAADVWCQSAFGPQTITGTFRMGG